ncbi:RND transporter [Phenylobacterium hankyongense]|uniref:RND transporter n=2 Tax=Phenylobacterium hankyongense TaxID=1813876 RepID=A0A328B627_9CAUL|nr:RND transporter [Phenylobacterium hankyongense]
MRLARTPLTVLTCAAVAGCAVGPNYARPSAPVSATFKEAAGWSPAAPADALERGDWWTLFGDPVLNGLMARVQVSNQNIIAAEAAYRQARALVSEQRAALFPTVNTSGSATRSGSGAGGSAIIVNPDGSTSGGSSGGTARNTYRVTLGASWAPDIWGRIRRTIEASRANAQASAADLAAARLAAQGELAANYFSLREAEAEMALDQATVASYRRTVQISQNQYNAGIAPRSNLLQAQTQLDNALADLAGTQQTRATYEHAIAMLVGEAPGNFSLATAAWTSTVPETPPGVPSTLLQRRPDIAAAERRMAAANAQVGVQVAAYFPSLSLTGSYGFASTELGALISAPNALWSMGASAAETLLDFGARRARVTEARAAYDQAVAQYRQTVLTALQDVENQLVATRVLAAQYDLRRDASAAADAAEQMVTNRYQAGQVSFVDVVTAQAAAYAARRALAQATAQRQNTAVALIQSLGGGWRPAP